MIFYKNYFKDMRMIFYSHARVSGLLALFLFLSAFSAISQTITDPYVFRCGTTVPSGSTTAGRLVGDGYGYGSYPAGAIISCDPRVEVYYDDIAESILHGEHAGFDDPTDAGGITVGNLRRNTVCMMLDYIAHPFDLSNIDPAHPIRIHMMRSFNPSYTRHRVRPFILNSMPVPFRTMIQQPMASKMAHWRIISKQA